MKRISIALLFATTTLGSAFADEFKFASNIDAVTVFPRGAEVERVTSGQLPVGNHVIVLENLPAHIAPDSVRVSGLSDGDIAIGSVDVRQIYLAQNVAPEQRTQLEMQIDVLNDEHMRLQQVIADTNLQRGMLENLISNAGKPNSGESGNSLSALEVADLLDGAALRLDNYAKRTIDARAKQRTIKRDISDIQKQIAQLAPQEELRSVVSINLNVTKASEAEFTVKYAIADAGWKAIYDASLELGDGSAPYMELVRRANVYQNTSESWADVSMKLSTARPSTRTFAPELSPFEIKQERPSPRVSSKLQVVEESLQSEYLSDRMSGDSVVAAPEPRQIENTDVVMDVGGFQATYQIPGKVTVNNTGAVKSVIMGGDRFDVALSAFAVPLLDPAAYLMANFTLEGEAMYLPGPVLLSRDGNYIGRGAMPLLAPGDAHDLSFGQDDFIKIERVETERKEGQSGLISASLTDERNATTTVENLHNFPIDVTIVDRLPVANHEDINIDILKGSTKVSQTDLDDRRGILSWDFKMDAGAKKAIDFGYRISWPKAMQISQLE